MSQSDGDDVAAIADVGPRVSRPYNAGNQYGLILVCLSVVVASMTMSIRDGQRVRLFGFPELPELCQFRSIYGVQCPGCGLTRSFISMGHFDVVAAWNYHSVGVCFFLVVVFQIPFRCLQISRHHRRLPQLHLGPAPQWVFGTLLVAAMIQWISRLL